MKEAGNAAIGEWEEANWHHVKERETEEEQRLSLEEIEWLNGWVKKDDNFRYRSC